MDLNNVTVEMRPRSEWEAVDFGARLVRRDAGAIYRVWFAVTIPMLLLAMMATLYTPYATLALFLYWWFEPVADGPILRIISRRLFGEDADVRSALRALPFLLKRNLIFLLPLYRFHMARSTAMPVTQLEGLRGSDRKARARVLSIKIANHGMGVTLAYHHLAMALYIGIYLIVFALVPTTYQETAGYDWLEMSWSDENRLAGAVSLLIIYVAQSALHPWFVGAGFGLYINCRTQLEAWDIEVAFRRMVQRRASGATTALLCALLATSLAITPTQSSAQDLPLESEDIAVESDPGFNGFWDDEEVAAALSDALQDEALNTTRTVEEWQKIDSAAVKPNLEGDGLNFFYEMLRGLGQFVSYFVEFGLWIIVAGLAVLIFVTRDRWLPYVGIDFNAPRKAKRVFLSSGEVLAESMPSDIPAQVLGLWNAGKRREALSLLYRGSVFAAVVHYGVRLPPSATEGLCVAAVREQAELAQADFFQRVVAAWVSCAYGFSSPDDQVVMPLCAEWQQHFGTAP